MWTTRKRGLHAPPDTYYNNGTDMETLVLVKIVQTGSSCGVIIPSGILRQLNLQRGDFLSLTVRGEAVLVLRPVTDAEIRALKEPSIQYD